MGANLARNFARKRLHRCHSPSARSPRPTPLPHMAMRATSFARRACRTVVSSLEKPRRVLIMVKAGGTGRLGDRPVGSAVGRRRHRYRCRQFPLRRHPPPRGRPCRKGSSLRGRRRVRRRRGRPVGPVDHARRFPESYDALGPMLEKISAQVDGEPCCAWVRDRRRRPLREDGAQRHRVRRHAGDRRSVTSCASVRGHWNEGERISWSSSSRPAEAEGELASSPIENRPPGPRPRGQPRSGKPLVDAHRRLAGQRGRAAGPFIQASTWFTDLGHAESVLARGRPSQRDACSAPMAPESRRDPRNGQSISAKTSSRTFARHSFASSWFPTRKPGHAQLRRRDTNLELKLVEIVFAGWRAVASSVPSCSRTITQGLRHRREARPTSSSSHLREAIGDAVPARRGAVIPPPYAGHAGARCSRRRWPTTTDCAADRLPAAFTQGLRDLFVRRPTSRVDIEGYIPHPVERRQDRNRSRRHALVFICIRQ